LASEYGRYGYRRITALLRSEGWDVNVKRRPAAHPLALVGILVEEPPGIVDALDVAVANAIAEQVIVSF
jgi:hypothetical protein